MTKTKDRSSRIRSLQALSQHYRLEVATLELARLRGGGETRKRDFGPAMILDGAARAPDPA